MHTISRIIMVALLNVVGLLFPMTLESLFINPCTAFQLMMPSARTTLSIAPSQQLSVKLPMLRQRIAPDIQQRRWFQSTDEEDDDDDDVANNIKRDMDRRKPLFMTSDSISIDHANNSQDTVNMDSTAVAADETEDEDTNDSSKIQFMATFLSNRLGMAWLRSKQPVEMNGLQRSSESVSFILDETGPNDDVLTGKLQKERPMAINVDNYVTAGSSLVEGTDEDTTISLEALDDNDTEHIEELVIETAAQATDMTSPVTESMFDLERLASNEDTKNDRIITSSDSPQDSSIIDTTVIVQQEDDELESVDERPLPMHYREGDRIVALRDEFTTTGFPEFISTEFGRPLEVIQSGLPPLREPTGLSKEPKRNSSSSLEATATSVADVRPFESVQQTIESKEVVENRVMDVDENLFYEVSPYPIEDIADDDNLVTAEVVSGTSSDGGSLPKSMIEAEAEASEGDVVSKWSEKIWDMDKPTSIDLTRPLDSTDPMAGWLNEATERTTKTSDERDIVGDSVHENDVGEIPVDPSKATVAGETENSSTKSIRPYDNWRDVSDIGPEYGPNEDEDEDTYYDDDEEDDSNEYDDVALKLMDERDTLDQKISQSIIPSSVKAAASPCSFQSLASFRVKNYVRPKRQIDEASLSLPDRAWEILLDLGMIQPTSESDSNCV